ncbi:MAG: class I SAM-dependent methyltransferase [Candidatus Pacebacteria bacterium]|nr:class I SAM-dependent methyltransferase [Candidatus Paceibacterota bacterium]MDD5357277.1 class I SAM-dependent methyltransferase [Candidatus Paceibacterota bacterium]
MNQKKVYSLVGYITSFYDALASLVGYKKSVEYFVAQLPFPEDAEIKVLDAGCGTGLYSFAVLKRFKNAKVIAFDLNKKLVEYVATKASRNVLSDRLSLFTADISGPLTEIEDKKFDLIITAGVLVYVPHEKTVRNLSRFLVMGGYFFDSPNRDSTWGRFVCKIYACRPYPAEEDISVFVDNGYVLEKDIKVSKNPAASFKDAHIFKKTGALAP